METVTTVGKHLATVITVGRQFVTIKLISVNSGIYGGIALPWLESGIPC